MLNTIQTRLVLFLTLPLILILFVALWHTRSILYEESLNRVKSHLYEQVQHQAAEISALLVEVESIANTTANLLGINPQLSISDLKKILTSNVSSNKIIYGAAIAYEPNSYKGKKLFSPYVYHDAQKLRYIDVAVDAYDYTESQWQWWNGPRTTSESIWTNPYFDEGAGGILMVTYSAPFFYNGKFTGVTTIDIDVSSLHETLALEGMSSENYAIVTNTGHFAYHYKKEFIGQSLFLLAQKFNTPKATEFARLMTTGGSGIFEYQVNDEKILSFYAPVGHFGWSFAIRISEKQAMQLSRLDDNSLFIWTAFITITAIFLTIFITGVFVINPLQNTSERLKKLSSNEPILHPGFESEEFKKLNQLLSEVHQRNQKIISQSADQLLNAEQQVTDKVSRLNRIERRYKSLINSELMNRMVINKSHVIIFANVLAKKTLHLDPESTPERNIFEYAYGKDGDALSSAITSLHNDNEPQVIDHFTFTNEDTQVSAHILLTPSDSTDGNVIITFLT